MQHSIQYIKDRLVSKKTRENMFNDFRPLAGPYELIKFDDRKGENITQPGQIKWLGNVIRDMERGDILYTLVGDLSSVYLWRDSHGMDPFSGEDTKARIQAQRRSDSPMTVKEARA